jgi:hypothetical protein
VPTQVKAWKTENEVDATAGETSGKNFYCDFHTFNLT